MSLITRTTFVRYSVALLVLSLLQGCSTDDTDASPSPLTVPKDLQINGTLWQRQPQMTDVDARMLTKALRRHPSIAENPFIQGDPLIYRSSADDMRFYWLSQTDTEVHWVFLEFQRSRFRSTDAGTGPPFSPND
mgnify:CR=1 FL=1